MITALVKLFIALNSENSTKQISYAIALAFVIGLTPLFNLHNILVILIALLVRIHLGTFLIAWPMFTLLGMALNQPLAQLGEFLLTTPSLQTLWQSLYQISLFKLAHFHHTTTLGSLLFALSLFAPLVWLSNVLIRKYRQHVMTFIMRLKIVQALKASRFVQVYQSMAGN